MSKQYLKQIKAIENGYQSAYVALKDYSTGLSTLFNPKRRAIKQALKKVKKNSPTNVVINTLFESIPSLATINPASKLGAIFYVIHKNEGDTAGINKAAKAGIKNIVSPNEINMVKLLKRYSAWGIVRLFTGELGNKHVRSVRSLLRQWDASDLSYDALIQQINALKIKKGDTLGELMSLASTPENDNHSSADTSTEDSPLTRQPEQDQIPEDEKARLSNAKRSSGGYNPHFTFSESPAPSQSMSTTLNELEETERRHQEKITEILAKEDEDRHKAEQEMRDLIAQQEQKHADYQKRIDAKKAEIEKEKTELADNINNLAHALENTRQLLDKPCQVLGITEDERLAKKQILENLLQRFKQIDTDSIKNLSLSNVRVIAKNIAAIEKERHELHSKCTNQSNPILSKMNEDLKRSEERFGKELDSLKSDDLAYQRELELLKQDMGRARTQFLQTVEPVASQLNLL